MDGRKEGRKFQGLIINSPIESPSNNKKLFTINY